MSSNIITDNSNNTQVVIEDDLKKIIDGCLNNDRLSQATLYKKFFGKMLSMTLRYAKNRDEAIEIVNEGFLKVYTNLNKYTMQGSFEGWIRKIIFHTAMDTIKVRLKYKDEPMAENFDASIPETISQNLNLNDLMKLLDKLPEATKTVFNLFAIEGYKHNEIGEILGISEGTSKWHVSEARKQLQRMINQLQF